MVNKKIAIISATLMLSSAMVVAADNGFKKSYDNFDLSSIKKDIKTLASDEFAGREPSGVGEKLTTDLLVSRFKSLGLTPGNGSSFYQKVPLMSITSTPESHLTIGDISFDYRKDYVATSRKPEKEIGLSGSDVVFVVLRYQCA